MWFKKKKKIKLKELYDVCDKIVGHYGGEYFESNQIYSNSNIQITFDYFLNPLKGKAVTIELKYKDIIISFMSTSIKFDYSLYEFFKPCDKIIDEINLEIDNAIFKMNNYEKEKEQCVQNELQHIKEILGIKD